MEDKGAQGPAVVLYKTHSYCPRCVLHSQLHLQPATVVQRQDRIWLYVQCKQHGSMETLYCSSAEFFNRMMSFTFESNESSIADIEDLKKKIDYNKESPNLPFCLELPVIENGNLLPDAEIKRRVNYYESLYPADRKFVLKITARMAMDMEKLNAKILFVRTLIPHNLLLMESSFERLVLLSQLQDSAFLCPNIYPALKYFLRKGDEELCKSELQQLFSSLKMFSGIQLMVTICVNRPFPKLDSIMDLLRMQNGFVRLIQFSLERPPKELIESVAKGCNVGVEAKLSKGETLGASESVDVYELLQHIQRATFNAITVDDYFPVSLASAMEPLLNLMGYGNFYIRPSPFCGFATCLVNTKKSFASYPATRLYDLEKIFNEIKPLVPKLHEGKIGLINGARLKKGNILQSCAIPNKGPLPDLYDYLTDKSKSEETSKFIQQLQFLVIHNNMDMLAFDFSRRCNCIVGGWSSSSSSSPSSSRNNNNSSSSSPIVSYCTGCI